MPEEIKTALSFIAGRVYVNPPEEFTRDRVTIYARTEQPPANINCSFEADGSGTHFQIPVPAGTWQVWAMIGLIQSEKQLVKVDAGKVAVLNFRFSVEGKDAG